MTPEELALIEAGASEDNAEEIDELSEQLAVHSIISEERHDEILERVDQCRTELERLSANGLTTAESPMLIQMVTQLAEIRAELTNLKSSQDRMDQTLRESSTQTRQEPEMVPEEPRAEELMVEPSEENEPGPVEAPRRRNRQVL